MINSFVKVGDKLIANDEFHWSGFINGEVIEVTPYDNDIYDISVSNIIDFGVTILANFKSKNDVTGQEYIYQKNIYSCSLKINPINLEINIDWSGYGNYAKAIFFTSDLEKKKFYDDYKRYINNFEKQ
jgi:hypothetical protein